MLESFRCSQCQIEFRTLEDMEGYWRLYHHQSVKHTVKCTDCDLKFTSYSQATIHSFQTHNIKCVRCGKICEGLCLEEVIKGLDKANYNEKEDMMKKLEKRIVEEEEQYMKHFEGVSEHDMEKLKDIVHALDEGYTGCLANSYGMLAYLPYLEANHKHGELTQFNRKLIEKYRFLSAMVKLNLYLRYIEQLYEGGLSIIIPTYLEDCVDLNIENENLTLTPEKLINKKLCFPERHIGGPDPKEWTENAFIKKFGVPDRQIIENESTSIDFRSSNQKEMTNQIMLNMESGLDNTFPNKEKNEFDLDDTFLSNDENEFNLDDTFLSEDIDDLLDYELPELSDDKELVNMKPNFDNSIIDLKIKDQWESESLELFNDDNAIPNTSELSLETVSYHKCNNTRKKQKKAINHEKDASENDANMKQITLSKTKFNHKTHSELSVGMKYDLDIDDSE